MVGKVGKMI